MFNIFQQFYAMVERVIGKWLNYLRTNNIGEYTSYEFRNYYSKLGHMKTILGSPQHNSLVERMNITIVERMQFMLRAPKLPKELQVVAVQTCCLINRIPLVPLDFDSPQRVWIGKDVSCSHLKVFSAKLLCIC